jgi:hypothetical protein
VVPDELFKAVDEMTETMRENFEIKNIIFNILVTANAMITDGLYPHVDKDGKVDINRFIDSMKSYEKGIDYRILESIDGFNYSDTFDFREITLKEAEKTEESESSEPTSETAVGESEESEEKSEEESVEKTLQQLDGSIQEHVIEGGDAKYFFRNDYKTIEPTSELGKQIEPLARRLASKLKGRYGKESTMNTSKKLNVKNFVRKDPRIYKRKTDLARGKKVKLNMILDCSGSMGGQYIQNSVAICMIVDKIAREEKSIDGKIILSAGEGSVVLDIGKTNIDKMINHIHAFSGSEGIANTLVEHVDILSKATYNICVSDAQITDDPINKKHYESRNVFIDGIYIGKIGESTKKRHIEHMEQYFSRGHILDNVEDAIEYIINNVLRS